LSGAEITEDRLFLIDASGSMNSKLGIKKRKIDIVKSGLTAFCSTRWPISYYNIPLNIGIVAFRLLGTPGKTVFETIVPISPSPTSLELYRLTDLSAKGGSWFMEALEYALLTLVESPRKVKRVDFVSDGTSEGPDSRPIAEKINNEGIILNTIEVSDDSTDLMMELAKLGGGSYHLAKNQASFDVSLA